MAEQRYRVIDRLEAGGMAEVFRGEAVAMQGFKKQVAIKRVLPHLAQNKQFIRMFLDEARLGARLSHANIVSVLDIGAADNTYFLVMEFIDGANLKSILEGVRKAGRTFPVKEAIYIAMEVARGLAYAHELAGDDGQPLHIVHRDVSPPNIMLTRQGEVKVTDFGLAKATTQLEKTDPGVVKGKFSYLSPEAALAQDVDERTDIFALGIVLWEMLAGRRLFLGETDYQTVKLVQQANVPSLSRLNPEVDEAFERVLGVALARDRGTRYRSAREFGDALADYLFSHQMKVTSYDIAKLVTEIAGESVRSIRPREPSIIDRLIQEELLAFTSIDEMADPLNLGATPLGPDDVRGARGAENDSLENPADWFSNDAEVGDAISSRAPAPGRTDAEWHESGQHTLSASAEGPTELANLLEEPTANNVNALIANAREHAHPADMIDAPLRASGRPRSAPSRSASQPGVSLEPPPLRGASAPALNQDSAPHAQAPAPSLPPVRTKANPPPPMAAPREPARTAPLHADPPPAFSKPPPSAPLDAPKAPRAPVETANAMTAEAPADSTKLYVAMGVALLLGAALVAYLGGLFG